MRQTIPLTALEQYPPHLASSPTAPGHYDDTNSRLRRLDRFSGAHRTALADAAIADLRHWDAPPGALKAAEQLRDASTYAVVTGQQAGIATGPLYTLYKAIGALRVARDMHARHPDHRFVAVFWIEADDHDFDEARHVGLIDRSGSSRTIAYDDGDQSRGHVGDRVVTQSALSAFVNDLRESLIETEFSSDVVAILEEAYGVEGSTLASGFARTMYALLGDVPLVVVSSRNSQLKRLASDVFEREARDPDALFAALERQTQSLKAEGFPTPITPKHGALFITHEGSRRSLDVVDASYALRDTTVRMSRDDLAEIARAYPERLSPNVALRPIVQDSILPTAVYLGGPSELAYLAQLIDAYEAFGVSPPRFAQRPFVLLMEPKARRALEGAGVTIEEVMQGDFNPSVRIVDADVEREIDNARTRAEAGLRSALGELEGVTKQIDPTLEKALGATRAGAEKGVEDFVKRLRSALKRKSQTEIDRLEAARELIMPARQLQERALNPMYYVNKYGLARFQSALAGIESSEGMLQVIDL